MPLAHLEYNPLQAGDELDALAAVTPLDSM
jgi:hypothetical protein